MALYRVKWFDNSEDEFEAKSVADAKKKGRAMNDCGVRSAVLLEDDDLEDEDLDADEDDEDSDDDEPAPRKRKR